MPSTIQRSFAGGEIAPALYARADIVKYQIGLRTCRNFQVMRHGGVQNRAGFQFIVTTKDSSRRSRLLKFRFNDDQTYVFESGHLYMRIVRLGAQITVAGLSAWVTSTAYVVGDLVAHNSVNYYCIQAHTSSASDEPGIGVNWEDFWYALTGDVFEIPTPYIEDDLADLHFTQSADVVTITHPSYDTRELRRTGHTAWTLVTVTFGPTIAAPGTFSVTFAGGGAGTKSYHYVVTAIAAETYEESARSLTESSATADAPSEDAPHELTWAAVAGADAFNVYRGAIDGVFGFLAQVTTTSFNDTGEILPDYTKAPPTGRNPFSGANNRAAEVTHFEQRRVFARSNNKTETCWGSKIGAFPNFDISYPTQPNDSFTFTLAGNEVNEIRWLLSVDSRFIVLTAGSLWELRGGVSGTITPTTPGAREFSNKGSSNVRPAIVDNSAIYVSARGNVVRDIRYEVVDTGGQTQSYRGRDLSVFATHLFQGRQVKDALAYQEYPESIVWGVRDDGVLLGLTYLREHDIWGWHRHDTQGAFESIVSVPEGDEDALYAIIRRTIGGATKRYIERMHSRRVSDIAIDAFFVDSGLSYDGRHTGSITMTLSGGSTWEHTETLTLTASSGFFVADDGGNEIRLRVSEEVEGEDGLTTTVTQELRFAIAAFTSSTVVTGNANKDVPVEFQNVAISDWGRAVDELAGLDHLLGKEAAILGDGQTKDPQTVGAVPSGIGVTLDRPHEVIHVGLRYVADLQTLDLESLQGQTLTDKQKRVNRVTVYTQESKGIKAGPRASRLKELPVDVDKYADPSEPEREKVEIVTTSEWNNHGRTFIRQDDPLPLTVLAIVPSGFIGG